MELEFINYVPTPNEKHLGIATIKLYGKLILRWKIIPNKDGSGYFPGCASYKVPCEGASDYYAEAFMLDSRSEDEEVKNFIRSHVKKHLQKSTSQIKKEESVFAPKQKEEELPF